MSLRWCSPELPPASIRDDGGTPVTGAADPRPGGRPGHGICEAVVFAAVVVASLAFVLYAVNAIHT